MVGTDGRAVGDIRGGSGGAGSGAEGAVSEVLRQQETLDLAVAARVLEAACDRHEQRQITAAELKRQVRRIARRLHQAAQRGAR